MTKFEWVQNPDGTQGKTWNPITGCSKVSEGCRTVLYQQVQCILYRRKIPYESPQG